MYAIAVERRISEIFAFQINFFVVWVSDNKHSQRDCKIFG